MIVFLISNIYRVRNLFNYACKVVRTNVNICWDGISFIEWFIRTIIRIESEV